MDDKNTKTGTTETPNPSDEKKEVKSWLAAIASTEKWRDQIGQKAGWKRFIDEYKNKWDFLQQSVSIPIVPVNLVYAYVKTEIARLYFRDPWITVNPKRGEDVGAAQIAEQVINYIWSDLKFKHQIKQALLETILVGHSWIKVGYVAEFGTMESQPKEVKRGPGRPPKEKEVDPSEYLKSENVFAYHVPYKEIIFDPSATYPATHNARWMAHRVVKPYRAVCESGIYENTQYLRPNATPDDLNAPFSSSETQTEFGKDVNSVILYEIYDLDHGTITTVSPGCDYRLRRVPLPEYLNGGFPFVQFAFNPVPGEVYPMSDIAPHEGQIIELTKIMSIQLNHLKRWNRQMIVDPDLFTPDEESKFKDANDGALIKSAIPGAKDKIFVPPYAPVQQDVYGVWNQVFDVWRNVAGQTQAEQGGQAKTQTRTLGELRMQLQGGKARSEEKIDVLEDAIAEVARKLLAIMQQKFDLPKITRIVGEKAVQDKLAKVLPGRPSTTDSVTSGSSFTADFGFSWNKKDILGEMDVDVLAGSTTPMDRESQLEIMEKMLPLLPALGAVPGSPGAKAYGREFLRLVGIPQLLNILDIVDQSPPQPDPEMMQAQAKMQESQAKIQGQMAQTQMKIQAKQKEEEIKLQAMKEKLELERQKNHMDLNKQMVQSILQQFRGPGGNGNGQSQE